jgi:predicted small secreted protein
MKKFFSFSIYLLFAIVAISCNTDTGIGTNVTPDTEAEVRASGLSLQVTFKNRSTATYTASKFIIEDEADGVKITLNPGTLGSQVLTGAESILNK